MKFVATETAEQLDLQTLPRYASSQAPASSMRSAASCWNVALPCGKACASCAQLSARR
jgi:hypothetical protein